MEVESPGPIERQMEQRRLTLTVGTTKLLPGTGCQPRGPHRTDMGVVAMQSRITLDRYAV
ncbi:hypothetical protein NSPZN2_50051 [Nitrospira defluvii]|uniref:Uncharacterized protein n=1 Tax=Nitrospira defluvii TaxID=330214 RepID=A0ABM8S213_9BACT|nr:hypothetical protein NSPZN2_50051 [Nitrospira defluvii]